MCSGIYLGLMVYLDETERFALEAISPARGSVGLQWRGRVRFVRCCSRGHLTAPASPAAQLPMQQLAAESPHRKPGSHVPMYAWE